MTSWSPTDPADATLSSLKSTAQLNASTVQNSVSNAVPPHEMCIASAVSQILQEEKNPSSNQNLTSKQGSCRRTPTFMQTTVCGDSFRSWTTKVRESKKLHHSLEHHADLPPRLEQAMTCSRQHNGNLNQHRSDQMAWFREGCAARYRPPFAFLADLLKLIGYADHDNVPSFMAG